MLRPLTILLLLMIANYAHVHAEDGPAYSAAHFVLISFPRPTFELVIASHIAQGFRSAQECFFGLSYGLMPPVLWLLGMIWIPVIGPNLGFWLAGIGLISSRFGTVYLVSRLPRASHS